MQSPREEDCPFPRTFRDVRSHQEATMEGEEAGGLIIPLSSPLDSPPPLCAVGLDLAYGCHPLTDPAQFMNSLERRPKSTRIITLVAIRYLRGDNLLRRKRTSDILSLRADGSFKPRTLSLSDMNAPRFAIDIDWALMPETSEWDRRRSSSRIVIVALNLCTAGSYQSHRGCDSTAYIVHDVIIQNTLIFTCTPKRQETPPRRQCENSSPRETFWRPRVWLEYWGLPFRLHLLDIRLRSRPHHLVAAALYNEGEGRHRRRCRLYALIGE
jgi:hypothetical protein